MWLVDATPDAWLIEVGPAQLLSGQLQRCTGNTGESTLSFVTKDGDTFLVANDPAGPTVHRCDNVLAYSVVPSHASYQSLWVIGPHSYVDLWEWRKRANAGLPSDVFLDADSGQVRLRQALANQGL